MENLSNKENVTLVNSSRVTIYDEWRDILVTFYES